MPAAPPRAFVVDTSRSPHARLRPVAITDVTLRDTFWQPRREVNRTATLPSQFRHIEETGRLDNFRRVSGRKAVEKFVGQFPFNDSDVYKWLEAAASALAEGDDPALAEMVQTAADEVEAAQRPDGYLNTFYAVERADQRWTNLRDQHELYCAGHFFQGALAHYRATGAEQMLNVARRFADHIVAMFGPEGRDGSCGHEEVELALVELYRATGERRYLEQAQRFIDLRGRTPSALYPANPGSAYHQDREPYRELKEVIGHAVRMMYLACGAADVYLETGEAALLDAMRRQWDNMTGRRMYVSGGLGARYEGEAFGKDYELPNERAYAETCAAIGSVMWNHRLLLATGEAKYADLLEHTLYNAVLPGVSLDGQAYFYENPLEDDGTHRRQPWFGCACCPPNVARLLAQLPGYFYGVSDDAVFVHLYAAGDARLTLEDGRTVELSVETAYPWNGDIRLTVQTPGDFALRLRVPAWAEGATLTVNDAPAEAAPAPGDYAEVRCDWNAGDSVRLHLPMPVRYVEAHPYVTEDRGRIAVLRGPLLYCAEAADHPGADVRHLVLPEVASSLVSEERPDLLGGIVTLSGPARVLPPDTGWQDGRLYRTVGSGACPEPPEGAPVTVTLIPYYAWANREPGRMAVWLRRDG
jgi:Uncharacterized protein conserved in bacteria